MALFTLAWSSGEEPRRRLAFLEIIVVFFSPPAASSVRMPSSLAWLAMFLAVFGFLFISYLILSTCLGPPLVRMFRSWLNTHYRAVNAREWDGGGAGYRQTQTASGRGGGGGRNSRRGFMDGSGGSEGYEMAAMSLEDFGEDD
ncbi:hypothetical protein C6P46_003402 [Rhodotorula mucilaginosa]|uniref:Uncharacterized protein n=1 Tax=Rhodotorula mucilaginosa TaxID=5537 RepID=A0A9P6W488_RHOMI|nr:hypothetical protein C6P46_003402 [Rhodotorula mucilaginosa]TKA57159.1 hypothetical protein B0A53_01115 [Rhodotorula sp. CCFEE 5036]